MSNENRKKPTERSYLDSPDPASDADNGGQQSPRLAALPQLSPEEYERVLQQVASELFLNDEKFRKSVVLREVRKILLGWGAAIGISSIIAVITLYVNARDALTQTVSAELSKAVKEHVNSRTELLNESIKSLTNTAVGQIVHVEKELEGAQGALDRAQQQLTFANQQSGDLQRRIAAISDTLRTVQNNAAWLGDSQNAQRVAGFIRTLSSERNAKAIGDLLVRLDRLEAWQIESQMVNRSNLLEETQKKAAEASRLLNLYPINKLPPNPTGGANTPHPFDKWDAYIKGADSTTK